MKRFVITRWGTTGAGFVGIGCTRLLDGYPQSGLAALGIGIVCCTVDFFLTEDYSVRIGDQRRKGRR